MLSDGKLLTAEVRRRPQLWDPGHSQYPDIALKKRVWEEVGAICGCTGT